MLSHFHLYGELRFSGVTGRRNGPSGLREDDDDDDVSLCTQHQTGDKLATILLPIQETC